VRYHGDADVPPQQPYQFHPAVTPETDNASGDLP